MQIFRYPLLNQWEQIVKRPLMDYSAKAEVVRDVMQNIREKGDAALREYTHKFDHVDIENPVIAPEDIKSSADQLS